MKIYILVRRNDQGLTKLFGKIVTARNVRKHRIVNGKKKIHISIFCLLLRFTLFSVQFSVKRRKSYLLKHVLFVIL